MKKNYFEKLVKYIKNVYKIDEGLRSLTDSRLNPTYQTGHVVSLALFGFLLRIKSFTQEYVRCLKSIQLEILKNY